MELIERIPHLCKTHNRLQCLNIHQSSIIYLQDLLTPLAQNICNMSISQFTNWMYSGRYEGVSNARMSKPVMEHLLGREITYDEYMEDDPSIIILLKVSMITSLVVALVIGLVSQNYVNPVNYPPIYPINIQKIINKTPNLINTLKRDKCL